MNNIIIPLFFILLVLVGIICVIVMIIQEKNNKKLQVLKELITKNIQQNIQNDINIKKEYQHLISDVLSILHFNDNLSYEKFDFSVSRKSRQAVDKYTDIDFFKEFPNKLASSLVILQIKKDYIEQISKFLKSNDYKEHSQYHKLEDMLKQNIADTKYLSNFVINVTYTSPAGKSKHSKLLYISEKRLLEIQNNPQLLMTKSEYNKYIKEQGQEILNQKHHQYYELVNKVIDYANDNRDILLINDDKNRLDSLISQLFDKTVNSIKKIKDINSEEWTMISNYIVAIKNEIDKLVQKTQQILDYYKSAQFIQIKNTCNSLMSTQKEFNEYIDEKAQSISKLFGTRVIRTETAVEDEYNYIRPYKKSITPFTAEVSANVFASAENNPINYIIKYFYPNKDKWPEQIQKLQTLIEELETLKEAKQIIENYKKDYQQYISNVPDYIMKYDLDGFYSRLGFANINENILTVEYKFSYTSNGGFSQRSFTVPMNEETIIKLIETLQNKLNQSSFSKEQRRLMTSKLRQKIKERDNFTCKYCGNSIYKEPNLLLEVDHITPIAKGGYTVEDNLQTLCWKCNRSKGSKLV